MRRALEAVRLEQGRATKGEGGHDGLSIDRIRQRLSGQTVGHRIELSGEVSSTNTVLRDLARAGAPEGTVVLAEAQSAGRGRLGRHWFSPPGVNLYASILFRPTIPPQAVPVFSFIASLALSDAISAEGAPATIKWPNDILVEGRKVRSGSGSTRRTGPWPSWPPGATGTS